VESKRVSTSACIIVLAMTGMIGIYICKKISQAMINNTNNLYDPNIPNIPIYTQYIYKDNK